MGGMETERQQINRIVKTGADEWHSPTAKFFVGEEVKPWIILNNAVVAGDQERGHLSLLQRADRGDEAARQAMIILMALRDLDVALSPESL